MKGLFGIWGVGSGESGMVYTYILRSIIGESQDKHRYTYLYTVFWDKARINSCLHPSAICGKFCFLHIFTGPLNCLEFLLFGIITDIKCYLIVAFIWISLITR